MANKASLEGRADTVAQNLIMLGVGGTAAAASFTHVHDWTVANGQPNWIGWANAVVLELIAVAAGLEIRRRRARSQRVGFVALVLVIAIGVSLTAQVADAELTVFGWLTAALPALGFLAIVKIVLGRPATVPVDEPTLATSQPAAPVRTPVPADRAVPVPSSSRVAPAATALQPIPAGVVVPSSGTVLDVPEVVDPPLPPDLVRNAQTAASTYFTRHGKAITRDELRSVLRVSNTTVSDLLRLVDRETPTVPARVNGATVGGGVRA